jgi:NADH pyrophosphatase NudC (nudix superfamily)
MNYCTDCGGKLTKNKTAYICQSCSKSYYLNPKAAVAIVLYDDQHRLVFARRAHEPNKGKLDCIGGFLDIDENFEQALSRELKEESGLNMDDISDLRYFGSSHDLYPWEGSAVSVSSVYFIAKLNQGAKLIAADDVASYERLLLHQMELEDFAWNKEIVKKLKTFETGFLDT